MNKLTMSRLLRPLHLLGMAAAAAFVVSATAGCASLAGNDPSTGWDVGSQEEVVELLVSNQNFKDARIYVRWDGERRRLGMVNGNSRQTFRLQWRPGATLRIEVDFVAGGSFVSSGVSTWPGEAFEFIIPAHA